MFTKKKKRVDIFINSFYISFQVWIEISKQGTLHTDGQNLLNSESTRLQFGHKFYFSFFLLTF